MKTAYSKEGYVRQIPDTATAAQYGFSETPPAGGVKQETPDAGMKYVQNADGSRSMVNANADLSTPAYDTVKPFGTTPGVLSSKDDAQGFKSDSTKLDEVLQGMGAALSDAQIAALEKLGYKEGDVIPGKGKLLPDGTFDKSQGGEPTDGKIALGKGEEDTTGSGDPAYDKMLSWQKEQSDKFEQSAIQRKAEYESLFKTSLSALDEATAATIQGINNTYDQRISEQRRINQLKIDRVKAYGLGGQGAISNPIEFTDVVSEREQDAADALMGLESERNSFIAQAKAARATGSSKLLRERLADIDKIDEQIRTNLKNVQEESEKQYKLLRDIRKEEETKHKEQVAKLVEQLKGIAPKYADEFGQMDDAEQDAFVNKIAKDTGLDYATVYSTLRGSVIESAKTKRADEKAQIDLDTAKLNYSKAKNKPAGTEAQQEDAKMKAALPASFKDDKDAEEQRKEFIKKFGTKGKAYWDAVYKDDASGTHEYPLDASDQYPSERKELKKGEILVKDKDGNIGAIPEDEFDKKLYTKV